MESELLNSRETELSILGSIMYEPGMFSRATALISEEDFFYPENSRVFQAMSALFAAGLDINIKSVWNYLYKQGYDGLTEQDIADMLLYRVDGASFVTFASQVAEFSGFRLLEGGMKRISASIKRKDSDLASYSAMLGELIRKVSSKDAHTEFSTGDALTSSFVELLRKEKNTLKYTGIPVIDNRLVDFDSKEISYLAARPGTGKEQALDAPILTPTGWVTMGDMYVGAEIIGGDGTVQRVAGVYPQGVKDEYELVFSDGTTATGGIEHLWVTKTRTERKTSRNGSTGEIIRPYNSRPFTVKTTREIMETLRCETLKDNRVNHSVPYVGAVEFLEKDVPLDPYILGILLGDGSLSVKKVSLTSVDPEIRNAALALKGTREVHSTTRASGVNFLQDSGVGSALSELGLLNKHSWEKFVPEAYIYNSKEVRTAILQGLLDTDGSVGEDSPTIEYSTTSPHLRDGVMEITRSLGGRATCKTRMGRYKKDGVYKETRENYRVTLSFPEGIEPFRLSRKLERYVPRTRLPDKFIMDVRPTGRKVEMQCIMVDSEEHTYVTNDYTVTHNTAMMLQSTRVNLESGARVGFLSMEMSVAKLMNRLISSRAEVNGEDMLKMHETEFVSNAALREALEWYSSVPLFIDDAGPFTQNSVMQKIRKMVYEHGCDVVYIDYIGLIQPSASNGSRNDQLSAISRELKGLSSELDIPLVIASQLSRDVVKRGNHRPNLADLRDSGALEQDASIVAFLYPDVAALSETNVTDVDSYLKEQSEVFVKFEIAKQRNGPVFSRELIFYKPYGRFVLKDEALATY